MAEEYGGEVAGDLVEGAINQASAQDNEAGIGDLLGQFTGGQGDKLQGLFGMLGGSGDGMEGRASEKGMDPSLITGMLSMLKGGGGASDEGGGGFNMGSLLQVAQMLTKGGGAGGGADGFLSLLNGLGGDGAGSSNKIMQVLVGLGKSYFAMKRGKDQNMQDWGQAGTNQNMEGNESGFMNWAMSLIKDLIFPGKKSKEVIDEDPSDKPTDPNDVKGWYDGHPEIGKMQKDIFDDVLDITGDDDPDVSEDEDPPLIPSPKGWEPDCSVLDEPTILFLNTNILLDLRREWRFLYSSKAHGKDFDAFFGAIEFQGPTILVITTPDGAMVGVFASTSWCDTEEGWTGNGDTYIFSCKPKMSIFYSTGKDENFMSLDRNSGLGVGGKIGRFGLGLDASLESGTFHEDVETFDLPPNPPQGLGEQFEVAHVEVWGLGPAPNPSDERNSSNIRKPNLELKGGNVDMNDLLSQIS